MSTFMQDALAGKIDYEHTIFRVLSNYEDFLKQAKQTSVGCPDIYGYPCMGGNECFKHNHWTCKHCYKLAFKYY